MADRYCDGLGPGYDRHRGEREYARRQDALSQTPKPTPAPAGAAIEALVKGPGHELRILHGNDGNFYLTLNDLEQLKIVRAPTLAEALARLAGKETT